MSAVRLRLIAFVPLLAGCVTHAPLWRGYDGPRRLPPELSDRFEPPKQAVCDQTTSTRRRLGFTVKKVLLSPASGTEQRIRVEYYDVVGNKRTPVVLLLPILNGQPLIPRYFARYFAHRGYAAVVVDGRGSTLEEDLSQPERFIRESVLDYRRVLDWIDQNPELDRRRIGVFGMSLGGMDAVALAAVDNRVDAVVAAMAGGDLPYVVMNTSYRLVHRAVSDVMDDAGLTRAELAARLRSRITSDPLDLAPYVDAHDVLMVLTRSDAIVPFEKQEELRVRMGGPEALYLPTGHRTSVIYFPRMRSTAYDFFARKFD